MEKSSKFVGRITGVLAVIILPACFWGMSSKFIALIKLVLSDHPKASEAAFAVAPMTNYMLATAGFVFLLFWAAANGMFRDIEKPKQTLLDVESRLDAQTNDEHFSSSVLG
ncbi:MAG: hypothetical protein KDA42_11150 [Planctomycetales bacterium]|nr:hypothetical protein [Planctomycetales bacterium]